jgi:hypothetical protein
MSLLASIPVIGQAIESIFGIIDKAVPDKDLAQNLKHQIMMADITYDTTELQAKRDVIVEELRQSDNYTKRARPTVIYVGIGAIVFNHCIVPLITTITKTIAQLQNIQLAIDLQPFNLPDGFWYAWGGLVCTYVIGRSAEKRGVQGKVIEMITGNKANT